MRISIFSTTKICEFVGLMRKVEEKREVERPKSR
jgi:hypothetical protein